MNLKLSTNKKPIVWILAVLFLVQMSWFEKQMTQHHQLSLPRRPSREQDTLEFLMIKAATVQRKQAF